MKKLTYSLSMAILLFTATSFTTVHHQNSFAVKNKLTKLTDVGGGFMHDGYFYEVTVNSTNRIVTSIVVHNAPFTVTSAGGFWGQSGNIHVTVYLGDGTNFVYEGPF
jgi:hypothetical protein